MGIFRQAPLELAFVNFRALEASEARRAPAQHADERELGGDDIGGESETRLARKGEGPLGLLFELGERLAAHQLQPDPGDFAVSCAGEIAAFSRDFQAALRDRGAKRPRIAAYLASERRIPFSQWGIWRYYKELDA